MTFTFVAEAPLTDRWPGRRRSSQTLEEAMRATAEQFTAPMHCINRRTRDLIVNALIQTTTQWFGHGEGPRVSFSDTVTVINP
jgi:hypothetical protein